MIEALHLVAFLLRISRGLPRARWKVLAALAAGVLSGLLYPLLIALLGTAIGRGPDRALLGGFLALCVAAPGTRLASQLLFDALGTRAIFDLRLQLCRRVLATPLGRLEEIGPPRLLASLSDDLTAITSTFSLFPMLAMQVGVTISSLAYMAWLSPRLFLLVAGTFVLGIAGLRLPGLRTRRYFERARRETDAMFAHFRDLIHGSKELKLYRERRHAFLAAELIPTGEAMRRSTFLGSTAFNAATAWGNLLFFCLLGLLLFGPARAGTDLRVLAGYLFALLYLKTPIEVLLQSLPALGRAAAAAAALQALEAELAPPAAGEPADDTAAAERGAWQRLELREVTHSYVHQGGTDRFTLGPLSLALAPGELVFLIGGNGSGKTTLAKILTGLYPPDAGQILLDGVAVDDATRDDYRQLFAAVFADFYLFETLLAPEGIDPAAAAAAHLPRLQLAGKVAVDGGRFSTLDLSQGQRKRLALVAAALEDRPLYFFDEWAADQDPSYKQIFYLELLPELKARGKTVVVISHDDAYYPVADRLIKLTQGRIEWERRPFPAASAPPARPDSRATA